MITAIILHYNRPDNITKIVDAIRGQTVPSEIWIWDNSGNCPDVGDVMIRSSKNFMQAARFGLLSMVQYEYVWQQDDDGVINDKHLFENLITESKEQPGKMLGWNGKVLGGDDIDKNKPYQHITGWAPMDTDCDMINTGFSFYPKTIINDILKNPYLELTADEYEHGDDIYVSHLTKVRRSKWIYNCIDMISENGHKLSGETHHMDIRNNLCKRYWL